MTERDDVPVAICKQLISSRRTYGLVLVYVREGVPSALVDVL